MGLWIEINHEDTLAGSGQGGGQVDRCGRLADSPLLIDDRDPSHELTSIVIDGRDCKDILTKKKHQKKCA
jgi:hypothetical protein